MASAMPVLPDVGSRMIDDSPSTPRRSRSSTRYFAARSFTEPVGFSISSLAKIRTSGSGDMRAISTSGVFPIASTMSVYPRPCPTCPPTWAVRVITSASAARHCRQDDQRVARVDGRRALLQVADVLVVQVDVDEPVQ